MAAPAQFKTVRSGNVTIKVNNPAYAQWLKSAEGQQYQSGKYTSGTIEGAAQTAMEETQRRAAEDRKLALGVNRARMVQLKIGNNDVDKPIEIREVTMDFDIKGKPKDWQ